MNKFYKEKNKEVNKQTENVNMQSEHTNSDLYNTEISYYVIEDLSSWANNSKERSALERFNNLPDALEKFISYRENEREYHDKMAKTTLGVAIGKVEFDVLHVRENENYLVQDFMLIKSALTNQNFLADLQTIHNKIGFDKISLTREMSPKEVKAFTKKRYEYQLRKGGLDDISVYMKNFDSLYTQNQLDSFLPTINQRRITEVIPVAEWKNEYLVQRESNEPMIIFTVAECGEFHNFGEFHEGINSVDEAIAIFYQIPPERMNGIPSIGINIHVPGTEYYQDIQCDIVSGNKIDLGLLDYWPEIKNNAKAMKLIAELIDKMPEIEMIGASEIDFLQEKTDTDI